MYIGDESALAIAGICGKKYDGQPDQALNRKENNSKQAEFLKPGAPFAFFIRNSLHQERKIG
jgi:hypothetical protein